MWDFHPHLTAYNQVHGKNVQCEKLMAVKKYFLADLPVLEKHWLVLQIQLF